MGFVPEGKLPGKTKYSGRRRSATRESGFHVYPGTTGGELRFSNADHSYRLAARQAMEVRFVVPAARKGQWVGFGGWLLAPRSVNYSVSTKPDKAEVVRTPPAAPSWSKFGSMWLSDGGRARATLTITASEPCEIALWHVDCGVIEHKHLRAARKPLLRNMFQLSPEAHFFVRKGTTSVNWLNGPPAAPGGRDHSVTLKSCNRCGRYLPVNIPEERNQLSFSNHCVAAHRRPCSHATFGRLHDVDSGKTVKLDYGFQLECRFCKKFEVNAAHNPQRSTAQMKEDAQRRRAFEELTTELYGGSPLLRYRAEKGGELSEDVFKRFGARCFKCGRRFREPREMHLDHTRPLALLWPLDGTATALCQEHNSEKRDRSPADYYSDTELARLAAITGLRLADLKDPSPNVDAVDKLRSRLGWFFEQFLVKPELTRERDGKTAAELLVKALQKVIDKCPRAHQFDIRAKFERLRAP